MKYKNGTSSMRVGPSSVPKTGQPSPQAAGCPVIQWTPGLMARGVSETTPVGAHQAGGSAILGGELHFQRLCHWVFLFTPDSI